MLGDHHLGYDRPTASGVAERLSGRIGCPFSAQQLRGSGLSAVGWDLAHLWFRHSWRRFGVDIPSG